MTPYYFCPLCNHPSRSEWGYRFHLSTHALNDTDAPQAPQPTALTQKYAERLQDAIARQQQAERNVRRERREA